MNGPCCNGRCNQGRDCSIQRASESYKRYEGAKSELTMLGHIVLMLLIVALAVAFALL